jgi:hypothetical protein
MWTKRSLLDMNPLFSRFRWYIGVIIYMMNIVATSDRQYAKIPVPVNIRIQKNAFKKYPLFSSTVPLSPIVPLSSIVPLSRPKTQGYYLTIKGVSLQ